MTNVECSGVDRRVPTTCPAVCDAIRSAPSPLPGPGHEGDSGTDWMSSCHRSLRGVHVERRRCRHRGGAMAWSPGVEGHGGHAGCAHHPPPHSARRIRLPPFAHVSSGVVPECPDELGHLNHWPGLPTTQLKNYMDQSMV